MTSLQQRLSGRLDDVTGDAGYEAGEHPPRMGFFTDTSVCIGCKACEVACKEWNDVPQQGSAGIGAMSAMSYDNTQALGADSWRHVAFVEKPAKPTFATTADLGLPGMGPPGFSDGVPAGDEGADQGTASGEDGGVRWLMSSDVCKHCTHAACLDVCPTGSLFRTEFGTVVVQPDICNGCGYCVPACPYGVIERREEDGRVFKCTLCYDRLKDGQQPACAQACPTESIQYGEVSELRERARLRVAELHDKGVDVARLYGADPDDGVGGDGAFFLLLDEPEVYGLPPDPVVTTRDLGTMWKHVGSAAVALVGLGVASFTSRRLVPRLLSTGFGGRLPGARR
ncbi:MAG TPA: 4Fe-4S dicluster domain-containing protein [Nocardioidaceae bacterium]|nr:4Fe-4S dicluster domain-containing protein [Nocardioidaceae bacterium]